MDSTAELPEIQAEEPESIIAMTLDIINIREFFRVIFKKLHIVATKPFVDGLILLLFLIILYKYANILILDLSWPMVIIYVVTIFILLDLSGANIDRIKGILFTEEKNRQFLENIYKYPDDELAIQTKIRKFSPSNITFFLTTIKNDPNKNYGFVFENILLKNELSPNNLDLLFTNEILGFCRDGVVIDLLIKYKDLLSKNNILNLFNYSKNNETLLKFIFATQKQSEFLYKQIIEKEDITIFYEQFQVNKSKEFTDLESQISKDPSRIMGFLFILFWLGAFISIVVMYTLQSSSSIADSSVVVTFIGLMSIPIAFIPTIIIDQIIWNNHKKKREMFIEYVKNDKKISKYY